MARGHAPRRRRGQPGATAVAEELAVGVEAAADLLEREAEGAPVVERHVQRPGRVQPLDGDLQPIVAVDGDRAISIAHPERAMDRCVASRRRDARDARQEPCSCGSRSPVLRFWADDAAPRPLGNRPPDVAVGPSTVRSRDRSRQCRPTPDAARPSRAAVQICLATRLSAEWSTQRSGADVRVRPLQDGATMGHGQRGRDAGGAGGGAVAG